MRIAILLPDLRGGGAERLRVYLANDWVGRGHSVELVLMRKRGELLPLVSPRVTVVDLEVDRTRHVVNALRLHLKRASPDVLLAAMWPLTVAAVTAHRLAGRPGRVVVSDHAPLSLVPETQGWRRRAVARASIGLTYPLAHARVGVSRGVADDVARLGGLDPRTMTVIYNPAARGDVGTRSDSPDPWPASDDRRVISVGTLKPEKDHATLLRAFARVRAQTKARLVILGEGSLRAELEALVAALGLRDSVMLPGFALNPRPWYLHADLFVLSSLYEGFGNVMVEAMECGLPVVSTDCVSGPREILEDGRYGELVPCGDAVGLADAILQALKQPRNAEAQQARAADFSVAKASESYLSLFESGRSAAGR